MPFFSRLRGKDKKPKSLVNGHTAPAKPQWSDAWLRTRVDPEEVVELSRGCTQELKSRALDMPFLLLPFRPTSDPSKARTFIRNYFFPQTEREELRGETLLRELRITEPMVLASVLKWCWSRLPSGIVTWEGYELFRVGERDSNYARDAFTTFIPISVESDARVQIIHHFFDLLAAIAAHGKMNGLGGRKLSRFAGWWAFEHYDTGKGFEAGYKSWASAANATSHLFFAYLRSLSPESAMGSNGILGLPRSLQQLVESTEYPPVTTTNLFEEATKVVMIVDVVSPTPFALLRRAKNFEYRDDDYALQHFSDYDDPIQALTEECRRVLKAISSTNQSTVSNSKTSTSLLDPSWSRFEDVGFGSTIEESDEEDGSLMGKRQRASDGLSASPRSRQDGNFARPTTPSWADFLSGGFVENENKTATPMLLPPDKQLPPISSTPRGHSSQSHRRQPENQSQLEPGELASIDRLDLDDSFWWVWISSLAGEEPTSRKAAFGRCALIETVVQGGRWMVMEEQVKGAAPEPATGAYIAEKKGFLGFTTRRGRLTRRRSAIKKSPLSPEPHKKNDFDPSSRVTILPDQHAKIQAAAAELSRKKRQENEAVAARLARSNNRVDANNKSKTNSMLSLQPFIMTEASPAMKWANQYDKQAIRAKYLGTDLARSESNELPKMPPRGFKENFSASTLHMSRGERDLPAPPIVEPEPSPILEAPANHDAFVRDPSPAVNEVPSLPAPTAAPPPLPVEPQQESRPQEAAEAAEIPLPDPTPAVEQPEALSQAPVEVAQQRPVTPQRPSSRLRKKSLDIPSPELRRRQQREKKASKGPPPAKSQQPSGFRQFFGTKKRSSKEQQVVPPGPPSPADPNPAIAAARAALEGKGQPQNGQPQNGQPAPNNEAALNQFMKSKGKKAPRAVQQPPITPPVSDHEEPAARSVDEERTPVAAEPTVEGPPRTRRDEEYDNLSRVDTNEREHADREFSTFDQGPLVDQPAFVPQEEYVPTPGPEVPGAFFTPSEEQAQPPSYSVYKSVTAQEPIAEEHDTATEELSKQVSPVDRWAQIRKNAAERAAKQSEEPSGRPSHTETRTDDGETSGEETIESRVARIKARVAELTGNMEAARR